MLDRRITPHMVSQAQVLLSRSAHWSRGSARTLDGALVNVVTFASSRTGKDGKTVVYMTRVDGACCSCPSFVNRQACVHAVACMLEAEQARERAARKPRKGYAELYKACQADGCTDDPEPREAFCYRHTTVSAF